MRAQAFLALHVILACAVTACEGLDPYSWSATEINEKKWVDIPRLQETQDALLPAQAPAKHVDAPMSISSGQLTSASRLWTSVPWLFSAICLFLLGWYCGVTQAEARHVLQQAAAKDAQEQQAQAAEAAEAAAMSDTSIALITLNGSPDKDGNTLEDADSLSSMDSAICSIQKDTTDAMADSPHKAQRSNSGSSSHHQTPDQTLQNSMPLEVLASFLQISYMLPETVR